MEKLERIDRREGDALNEIIYSFKASTMPSTIWYIGN
jgi:hypothetical protein